MADRRIGNGSMGRRGRPRKETGTCNVCSAPCSSCMHRNGLSFIGSKLDESSDENSHGVVVASQCSINEVKALGGSLRNSASEASSLVNSNHDTSSEAKSQARNISGKGKAKERSGTDGNNNKEKINVLSGSSTSSDESEKKSGKKSRLKKTEEANTSAMSEKSESESESENESADSEMLELDVKVCDICGDAGREDLLAICSRCSDGAEHTYCMRVMLKKVPEGDWLCEECKFAEEAEKKKLETIRKREAESNLNAQSSNKRQIDKSETAPDAKRQAVEAPIGSPKRSSLPKLPVFSRETSFKGVEKPTRKLAHHSSFNSHSSDDTESTRSSDSQLQSSKGSFLKSNSFNSSSSRPKVRQVDDVMLPRQKTEKDNGSLDVKDAVSSKNIDLGNSRGRDSKGLQSDGSRQGSFTKPGRYLNRNRLEDIVASVGDSSTTNEKCSSSEQTSSEAKRKDDVDGSTRNIREDINKGNRLRAAVDAALRKKPSFGKNRGLEQSDLANKVDSSSDNKVPSKFPVTRDWPVGLQQRTDKQTIARADTTVATEPEAVKPFTRDWPVGLQRTEKQTVAVPEAVKPFVRDWPVGLQRTEKQVNGKQPTPAPARADTTIVSQMTEPEAVKSVMRDFPVVASTILSTTSAIPEHEYIWQGDLEVQRSRNQSGMYNGIQAYISTLASPKVTEVVQNQFPVKLALNEVPRLSTWPTQFHDKGVKEEHVALFFFAKDIESYGKSYKPMVDNMIEKDLALKGNLEGVELLIFASNQLPQNCQRWNMLYFLWGVFRGRRKENCSNPLKNTPLPAPSENPRSKRESSVDRVWSRTKSCLKEESGEKDEETFGAKNVEEAEEGEIGVVTHLKDEKNKTKRIVFPLDLNEEKVEEEEDNDDEMIVDNNNNPILGMVPNLELALGEEKQGAVVLPFMARTANSIEEHRTSSSNNQEEDGDDDAASLSLSLSFSSLEQQKKQKQNVNTPLFLFKD